MSMTAHNPRLTRVSPSPWLWWVCWCVEARVLIKQEQAQLQSNVDTAVTHTVTTPHPTHCRKCSPQVQVVAEATAVDPEVGALRQKQ